jgi:hypothetical protein
MTELTDLTEVTDMTGEQANERCGTRDRGQEGRCANATS